MFQKARKKAIRTILFISLLLVLLAVLFIAMGDFFIVLGVLVLALAVFLPIYGGTRLWNKDIVKYCKTTPSPDGTYAQLEAFADATPVTGLLTVGDRWILISGNTRLQVLETPHVIWAFQHVTNQKLYGLITLSKSYSLGLAMDNGKYVTIPGSKRKVEEALQALYQKTDHIMIGFDNQLSQMFQHKDYQGLRDAAKQIRERSARA